MKLNFIVLAGLLFFSSQAFASESQFGFVYTTDLLPKDQKEVEQWVTWRTKKNGGTFNLLQGRTSFEYGLADNYQLSIYLNYAYAHAFHNGPFGATDAPETFASDRVGSDDSYSASRFVGVSVEQIYRILSPYIDPVGLALYLEPTIGGQFVELETRLILQKNFLEDTLIFGFNYTYAPEFRLLPDDNGGNAWQEETDMNFALAGSYRFIPNWSAGFEFLNEREYGSLGINQLANSGYYFGPSIHYGAKSFFLTTVFLAQMPWATEHSATVPGGVVNGYVVDNDFERYRLRVKAGFYF